MENMTHTYRGKEYSITLDGEFWFLDVSCGIISGVLPLNKSELNQGIREWNRRMEIRKANAPTCKGCKKDPTEIKEYQSRKDPISFVMENERFIPNSTQFYCTTCYVKAGMPLF